jgi:predicted ATPase
MRQVLCPVLVGREDEVQVLRDGLDRAGEGHGGTFFVVGEAGVGKSRLVREVSRRARSDGFSVLTGRAVAGDIPVAFRPLAEAVLGGLRQHGRLDPPELRPFRPALGRLVPPWHDG